jgi:hypothetical protein
MYAAITWFVIAAVATVIGALLSFGTGDSNELPQWNGMEYLVFMSLGGALAGALVGMPFALIVLIASLLTAHSDGGALQSAKPPLQERHPPNAG